MSLFHFKFATIIVLLGLLSLACGPGFLAQSAPTPTATATKTPPSPLIAAPDPALFTPTPTLTSPPPTPTDTPMPPTQTPTSPPTEEPTAASAPPTDTPVPVPPAATPLPEAPPPEAAEVAAEPAEIAPEPEAAEPESQEDVAYKIVHFKVLGDGENNGGIFSSGGQHLIFLTVLDENGNGLDGAVVKDANGHNLEVVTGDKGPGKAEISMEWDPYKLYVAADPGGPTTSEVSNQMNTAFPHIPDVVGKLGPADNPASVCPTIDFQCEPPFYSVHFSYEITFQKVN